MLENINNYTYKSFKNYTGPLSTEKFKRVNMIFGYNGKGKTALAKGIIEEFLKDPSNSENNYRFYDKDYIKNNLLIENSNSLKGIVATFGEKNVDVEKEIIEKKKQLKDTSEISKNLEIINKKINNEIDNIFNLKKGKSTIKKKSANSIEELYEAYTKDLVTALKLVNNEEELKNTKDSSEYEKELLKIENLKIINIDLIDAQEIISISEILSNEYSKVEIPSIEIIEWLKTGLHIHKKKNTEKCIFCSGDLDLNKIEDKITTYLSNKKQQDLQKLDNFRKKIDIILNNKEKIDENKNIVSSIIGDHVNIYYDELNENILNLEKYIKIINSKIENMSIQIEFNTKEFIKIMNNITSLINSINEEKNKKKKNLNEKIEKSNILIKGSIALEVSNNSLIKSLMEDKKKNDSDLIEMEISNKKILEEITKLKNSKSTTSDFADYLNNLLLQLGVDFYLDIIENNYIIKHRQDRISLSLDDISEGENNLLALLFFYYELFEDDKQTQYKDNIKILVIDDPISSVDDINKMYILELVKKISNLEYPQIFIFTHVWDDFCDLCYGKKDIDTNNRETPYRFYEVKKNSTGSYLTKTKTNETPYKHDFKEIYDFSNKTNADDLTDCEIYHYPNIMRKVLEEYMKFKVSNSSPTLDNINNVKIALCKNVNEASSNDNIQIPVLLDVCNILSHRSTRNPEQILNSAKYLMKKIKEADINHFSSMIN